MSLDASHISQGAKSHSHVREILKNKTDTDNIFPRFIDGDFISGSYSRGTKIHPLDDIDIMMVMDGNGLCAINKGSIVNAEVRSGNSEDNPILNHLGFNNLLSSKKIIDLFSSALRESYPASTVAKDGQAVNVWLESYNLGIDIVPCFHIIPRDGSQEYYYIPEGGISEGWISTNPNIDKNISEAFVRRFGDNFKNFVRLIKFWNEKKNSGRLRSYHLETVIWQVMRNYSQAITDYGHSVAYFFENCHDHLSNNCPDATGIGDSVDKYLSIISRLSSLEKVKETQGHIQSAELSRLLNDYNQYQDAWEKALNFPLS
jgi:hypothetical protein